MNKLFRQLDIAFLPYFFEVFLNMCGGVLLVLWL